MIDLDSESDCFWDLADRWPEAEFRDIVKVSGGSGVHHHCTSV